MALFRQILFTAAVAGFLGGVLLTLLQNIGTIGVDPLILRAETYEKAAEKTSQLVEVVWPGNINITTEVNLIAFVGCLAAKDHH